MNELDSTASLLGGTSSSYKATKLKPIDTISFKIKRIAIFIIIVICDLLVFFQRASTNVLGDDVARSYGCKPSQLGLFSSIFYYSCSILQPFAGLLSDVIEPSYLLGVSMLFGSIGGVICGASNSLIVGCIGRFIVGVGSGSVYCSANRTTMNWFKLEHYAKVAGLYQFIAGMGTLLAQAPLALLSEKIGWRWCFYIMSISSGLFGILTLLLVRGNPVTLGYLPVNESLANDPSKTTNSEKLNKMISIFKTVLSYPSFWLVALYAFFGGGGTGSLTGSWGCKYLMDVFGFKKVKAGSALLFMTIGSSVGSFILPFLADVFPSKKWATFILTVISMLLLVPFVVFSRDNTKETAENFFFNTDITLNFWSISLLFFLFSMTSYSWVLYYPMCTEYFHPEAAATVGGWLNGFSFVSSTAFMPFTGLILDHFGYVPGLPDVFKSIGYIYGIWVIAIAAIFLSLIFLVFARDPKGHAYMTGYEKTPDISSISSQK